MHLVYVTMICDYNTVCIKHLMNRLMTLVYIWFIFYRRINYYFQKQILLEYGKWERDGVNQETRNGNFLVNDFWTPPFPRPPPCYQFFYMDVICNTWI